MAKGAIGFQRDKNSDRKGGAMKALEKLFSPEFRNRLDSMVAFSSLEQPVMEMIVDKFIKELNDQLQDRRVVVTLTPEARTRMAELGHDPDMGARPMGRVIQTEIKDVIADELLFGELARGGVVTVSVAGKSAAKSKGKKGEAKTVGDGSGEFSFSFEPTGGSGPKS
jgi:ATP-dependent Clp protease ATP-binding subunit ClpA